jgi:hypothetical protein
LLFAGKRKQIPNYCDPHYRLDNLGIGLDIQATQPDSCGHPLPQGARRGFTDWIKPMQGLLRAAFVVDCLITH